MSGKSTEGVVFFWIVVLILMAAVVTSKYPATTEQPQQAAQKQPQNKCDCNAECACYKQEAAAPKNADAHPEENVSGTDQIAQQKSQIHALLDRAEALLTD